MAVDRLVLDRLADFQRLARSKGTLPEGAPRDRSGARLLHEAAAPGRRTGFMREFFDAVGEIQGEIKLGREGVEAMSQVIEEALLATTQERERAASERIQRLVEDTTARVTAAKVALEQLKARSDHEAKAKPNPAEARIRSNMQQAMARKHQQLLLGFQKAQMDFKQVLQRRQAREMQLLCPEASEEEVREMIEAGETSSQVVMRRMAGAHAMILDEVQRIRDKHQDILRLEQSVQDLAQMFQEVAVLVDAQGEMLDAIEVNVHNANDYTKKAVVELTTARRVQHNTRKWMCCIMFVLLVIAMAILFPVVFTRK